MQRKIVKCGEMSVDIMKHRVVISINIIFAQPIYCTRMIARVSFVCIREKTEFPGNAGGLSGEIMWRELLRAVTCYFYNCDTSGTSRFRGAARK